MMVFEHGNHIHQTAAEREACKDTAAAAQRARRAREEREALERAMARTMCR